MVKVKVRIIVRVMFRIKVRVMVRVNVNYYAYKKLSYLSIIQSKYYQFNLINNYPNKKASLSNIDIIFIFLF